MGRPLRSVTPVQRPSLLTRMTPVFAETLHRKRLVLALVWRMLRSRFVSPSAMWGNSVVVPTGTRTSVASMALHLQRRSFSASCSADPCFMISCRRVSRSFRPIIPPIPLKTNYRPHAFQRVGPHFHALCLATGFLVFWPYTLSQLNFLRSWHPS
jgi:hypothetical protein